jgi:hypothetical protein
MKEENKVWVIMWRFHDESASGIVGNYAYKDWQAAQHIKQTLVDEGAPKTYEVVELGLIQGELK